MVVCRRRFCFDKPRLPLLPKRPAYPTTGGSRSEGLGVSQEAALQRPLRGYVPSEPRGSGHRPSDPPRVPRGPLSEHPLTSLQPSTNKGSASKTPQTNRWLEIQNAHIPTQRPTSDAFRPKLHRLLSTCRRKGLKDQVSGPTVVRSPVSAVSGLACHCCAGPFDRQTLCERQEEPLVKGPSDPLNLQERPSEAPQSHRVNPLSGQEEGLALWQLWLAHRQGSHACEIRIHPTKRIPGSLLFHLRLVAAY